MNRVLAESALRLLMPARNARDVAMRCSVRALIRRYLGMLRSPALA